MLSWRASLGYKPLKNGTIYFGYGTSFNPSIDAGNAGLALAENNAALDPEESRAFELGSKWDFFDERLSLSAALFRTEKTHARTPGVNPGDPPLVLDGEQVVQGVEFGVVGSITEDLRIFASYAYQESEIETSNNEAEVGAEFGNLPEHSASVWLSYQLPWNIEIGGGAYYTGGRFNNLSSNVAVREAPDYVVFDGMVSYRFRNMTLRLNVNNIADEEYIDRVGGGHFIPGPGRSATLTASLRF
jgi:catecholate siderophore receptor